MSLFENEAYRWRDTYFVLFREKDRPSCEATLHAFESLGPRHSVQDLRRDDSGRLESLTLLSPDDFSAMDISYVSGEEVTEQVENLLQDYEQAEIDKAALWLKEKKNEIIAEYEEKVAEMVREKEFAQQKAVKESEEIAARTVKKALEHAERLRSLSDHSLLEVLTIRLVSIIAGQFS